MSTSSTRARAGSRSRGAASAARSSSASGTRSVNASPRTGRCCCSGRSARRRSSASSRRSRSVPRGAPRSRAPREDRRGSLQRLRLPRVVPARHVRREDPARVRVHERPGLDAGSSRSAWARPFSLRRRDCAAPELHIPTEGGGCTPFPCGRDYRLVAGFSVTVVCRFRCTGSGKETCGGLPPPPRRSRPPGSVRGARSRSLPRRGRRAGASSDDRRGAGRRPA